MNSVNISNNEKAKQAKLNAELGNIKAIIFCKIYLNTQKKIFHLEL